MKAKTQLRFEEMPHDYSGLCRLLIPRPIHDRIAYANVAEIADAMALWQGGFTSDQQDYFDLLCTLMEEFDRDIKPWLKLSPTERLRHLIEESGMTPADLSRLLGGSRNLGAMILRGDRNLTLAHVRKLAAHFDVSSDLFV